MRIATAIAMAVPTPLKRGTLATAMTTYATTTVMPAVRTACPAHRTDMATLSSVVLALCPLLSSSSELEDRIVDGEAEVEQYGQRRSEEGERPVPDVDHAEVDHGEGDRYALCLRSSPG